ncbi:hypothetical protein CC2G_013776 [Coprinopsis cinerea AmutBmut pab1-1]|nr:hypothetical protein CC2G_013776 [Coprinopsis cinerea AmutBmut pab1-1]
MTPGTVYEVIGSPRRYDINGPEQVVPGKAKTFKGMKTLGTIPASQLNQVEELLLNTSLEQKNRNWHCQHWVIAALDKLREAGFDITPITHDGLLARFNANAENK